MQGVTISPIRKDLISSHLRLQMNRLRSILENIEEERSGCDYAHESLKQIEVNLRQIRKLCTVN